MKNKVAQVIKNITQEQNKIGIIVLLAVIGLTLALLPKQSQNLSPTHVSTDETDESEYILQLEKRLSETLKTIEGAGKTKVFITLAGSGETVYLTNAKLDESIDAVSQTRTTSEKHLATMKNGTSTETPVIVKKIAPKISGVLIVCEGGENQNVKSNIIKAASTALDVSSSRIYVTGGQIPQ